MATPFNVSIHDHALRNIYADGYNGVFFEIGNSTNGRTAPDPYEWPVDGIIAEGDSELLVRNCRLYGHSMPTVSLGTRTCPLADRVTFDMTTGVNETLEHFVAEGRRRIAHFLPVGEGPEHPEERRDTYLAFMLAHGLKPELIYCDFSERSRLQVMQDLEAYIDRHGCPDAILTHNDELAITANRLLRRKGIWVPDDTYLVGCDGWSETEYQYPQLSTIDIPLEVGCRHAWTFLKNRIANRDIPQQSIVIPTKFVLRASASPAHSGDVLPE